MKRIVEYLLSKSKNKVAKDLSFDEFQKCLNELSTTLYEPDSGGIAHAAPHRAKTVLDPGGFEEDIPFATLEIYDNYWISYEEDCSTLTIVTGWRGEKEIHKTEKNIPFDTIETENNTYCKYTEDNARMLADALLKYAK